MLTIFASRGDLQAIAAVQKPHQKPFDVDILRIVAFSDYRVQDHALLLQFVRAIQPSPNLILYAGDDVERFHTESQNFFEELAALSTHGLCAVVGNDALPGARDAARIRLLDEVKSARAYIRGTNVFDVHEMPLIIGDYAVIGNEGAPLDERFGAMGTISYPEKLISSHLRLAAQSVKGKKLIVVSHAPPRGVLDTAIRFGERPIGSKALYDFLKKRRDVSLVVCGHVHSCGAQAKRMNRCLVVNTASHDDLGAPGRIAVIEAQAGVVRSLEWHYIWEISSVPGIREGRQEKLRAAGINTLAQLHDLTDEGLHAILKCGRSEAGSLRSRALALLSQKAVIRRTIEIPPSGNRAYLDIETDLKCKWIWLIGVHVEHENRTYSFFANSPEDEENMLAEFLAFTEGRADLPLLTYSNSRTEERMLMQRLATHNLPGACVSRIRDLYYEIHSCAAFPVQSSMGLKAIAECCGFEPRTNLDGFGAAILYGSGSVSRQNKKKLLAYNEDDLLALKHLVLYIEMHSPQRAVAAQASLY